jgi:hypothetical protein
MNGPFTFTDALIFAAEAHKGQKDRGGVEYIKHPLYVAHKVARKGGSNEAQMAAVMHDAIEDGSGGQYESSYRQLSRLGCPESVIDALSLLTHVTDEIFIAEKIEKLKLVLHPSDDNGDKDIWTPIAKEEEYLRYVAKLSHNDIARMVKIEDLRHNSDIRRIKPDEIDGKTAERVVKYGKALRMLNGGKFGYV